jgi:hypothetical protein
MQRRKIKNKNNISLNSSQVVYTESLDIIIKSDKIKTQQFASKENQQTMIPYRRDFLRRP